MRENMQGGMYSGILDQPGFAARFGLQQAFDHSRPPREPCKEWQTHISRLP